MRVAIIALFLLIQNCQNQDIRPFQPCTDIIPMPEFDPEQFQGKWYELYRVQNNLEFPRSTCNQLLFGNEDIENGFLTITVQDRRRGRFGLPETIVGIAKWDASKELGQFALFMGPNAALASILPKTPNRIITDTDYENYAVMQSCIPFGFGSLRYAYILTRELGAEAEGQVAEIVSSIPSLKKTTQTNCPAFQ